jgi:two-component system chemotaxis response regulator CheB
MVPQIPSDVPPILVVQHMPEVFTAKFAESLNAIGSIRVIEATHNLSIERGTMYIAPGGRQMRLVRTKTDLLQIQLTDDPPMNRFKPSVDYLFQSIAELDLCRKTRAAILTGMGEDGARGMLKMHQAGAYTVAQNEDSCVVFGMPKAAIEFNSVDEVGDIDGVLRGLLSGSVNDKAA